MGISDWNITGPGGQSVVADGGSLRCVLSGKKLMLWNGNSSLADAQVSVEVKFSYRSTNAYLLGGPVLRMDASGNNGYRDRIHSYNSTTRRHRIERITDGIVTVLSYIDSVGRSYDEFVNTKFRADGWQLSVEEYIDGEWTLIGVIEDTNHSHTSGYAGLQGECVNTSYQVYFDNIEISEEV